MDASYELANNKSSFIKKRKADELSEVSDNSYESVCPVYLVTGKCDRKGCNLPHLDETKKKEFLARFGLYICFIYSLSCIFRSSDIYIRDAILNFKLLRASYETRIQQAPIHAWIINGPMASY